jgi:hypothetical protein
VDQPDALFRHVLLQELVLDVAQLLDLGGGDYHGVSRLGLMDGLTPSDD